MTVTEVEAKTKHCCGWNGVGAWQEPVIALGRHYCVGSACMAWRWRGEAFETCETIHNPHVRPQDEGLGEGWEWLSRENFYPSGSHAWQRPNVNRDGYCGLAGQP